MLNANHTLRRYTKVTRQAALGVLTAAALGAAATAQATFAGEPDENGVLRGTTGEVLSAVGIERGLDLYDRDASDPCRADRTQIRVVVTGVSRQGILKLELFGEKDFLKKSGKLRKVRIPAEESPMLVCMDVPAPGDYAVVGYHDQDGDRRLDKKWNFKPKEPYGLSNNPNIESLRLPKWEETRFPVPVEGRDIAINLVDLG